LILSARLRREIRSRFFHSGFIRASGNWKFGENPDKLLRALGEVFVNEAGGIRVQGLEAR
jgi:hypothetical protein